MKKIIGLLLISFISSSFLTACGDNTDDEFKKAQLEQMKKQKEDEKKQKEWLDDFLKDDLK